jgi:membrane peptidoglycan carboxypeptidase
MATKRTVRRPAKPSRVNGKTPVSWKERLGASLKGFFLAFTSPSRFKAYWLSRAGLIRVGKLAGAFVLFVLAVFIFYIPTLPKPGQINAALGATTTFYARDAYNASNNTTNFTEANKLYEIHGSENRVVDDFSTIPTNLKNATIAIEDRNFYKEGAFSVIGIARSAFYDLVKHGAYQGGSTITQQYVKGALLTDSKSISRKIKELILSIEINQFYSKDQILGLYLNEIPYSNGAYGIEAACRTYFSNKYGNNNCASHLDLGESALLASIPNLPSYYNPYGQNTADLLDRQHLVLDNMLKQGYITQAQATAARWTAANLDTVTPNNPSLAINKEPAFYSAINAPNFVLTLQNQLEQTYGSAAVDEGGWKVITTLDRTMQSNAEKSIYNKCNPSDPSADHSFDKYNRCDTNGGANYDQLVRSSGSNAALVAADPNTGQVYAMVGSYNFAQTQVNVATSARQPGSSFKPYVYATLMSQNKSGCSLTASSCPTYGAGSILTDSTTNFGTASNPYTPSDYDGRNRGPVTMRTALGGSLNIPAVNALQLAGTSQAIATAHSMGITTLNNDPSSYGLSLVLGSGEVQLNDHVSAYESFANGGLHYTPTMALKIYDKNNKVIVDNTKPATPKRVLDPQVAYIINNMLSDADAKNYIFGNILNVSGFVGHGLAGQGLAIKTGTTSDYRDAWTMGYTPSLVAGVWAGNNDDSKMTAEAADISAPMWKSFMAVSLAGKPIDTFAKPAGIQTLTIPGSAYVSSGSTNYQDLFPSWYKATKAKAVVIDIVSGLLATDCTPALAKKTVYYPISGNDNVHACGDAQPSVTISGVNGTGPTYNGTATIIAGKFNPTKLDIQLDDQIVSTQAINGSGSYSFSLTAPTGSHSVRAVVTDDGYYQGSSDVSTVLVGGNTDGNFSGTSPADGSIQNKGTIIFIWTPLSGASSYKLYVDALPPVTTNSTSEPFVVKTTGVTHSWHVTADTGQSTTPLSFTVQ